MALAEQRVAPADDGDRDAGIEQEPASARASARRLNFAVNRNIHTGLQNAYSLGGNSKFVSASGWDSAIISGISRLAGVTQLNADGANQAEANAADVDPPSLRPAPQVLESANAAQYANLGSMQGQDIEALAFLVLMQASKSAQEDLKSIMDGVKQMNSARSRLREECSENVSGIVKKRS